MLDKLRIEDVPESVRDIAEDIGIEAFAKLIKRLGGTTIYFPNEECVTRPVRNRIIKEKFKGDYKELAKMFGMTTIQIKNIVNDR